MALSLNRTRTHIVVILAIQETPPNSNLAKARVGMTDPKLRYLFNRAVTDLDFRDSLFRNLHGVLLEHGIEEKLICLIEASNPQDIQDLAKALSKLTE